MDKKNALKRFDDVLSVYGADSARWPEAERDALTALARDDGDAARLLGEAVALEKVMAHAPAGDAGAALRDRIVASALADGARDATVVPLEAARSARRRGFGMDPGRAWPAAAMAACFALGLYLGIAGMGVQTFTNALSLAALNGSDSTEFLSDGGSGDSEGLI